MAAYFIAIPEAVLDPTSMQKYAANTPTIVESFGGRYLVARGPTRTLEGNWDPRVMVLIEFPSIDRLLEFYESPEYRPWRELRQKAAKAAIVATEGT
jgi:uncharacterized protein (DUF1330 family)